MALQAEVRRLLGRLLAAVQVRTPDPALDLMLNRWLLYQVLGLPRLGPVGVLPVRRSVRLPRSAAGRHGPGCTLPRRRRADQILRAAARQFDEGDVQHWWHPPTGRGVRTRFSDDLLWLPLVVHHYVADDRRHRPPRRASALPEGAAC